MISRDAYLNPDQQIVRATPYWTEHLRTRNFTHAERVAHEAAKRVSTNG